MLTDPIADMLTRIRNANKAMHDTRRDADLAHEGGDRPPPQGGGLHQGLPASSRATPFATLVVELKFGRNRERVITDLKRVSKPGRRVYARKDRLPRVLGGMGTAILSTSTGVITSRRPRSAASAARSSASSGSAHESNRQTSPIEVPDAASPSRSSPWPRDGQRAARRARAAGSRADADRAGGRRSSSSRGRPSAATTARCTASRARWSRTWSRASRRASRSTSRSRASATARRCSGTDLELNVGYSHPVVDRRRAPGITFEVPTPTEIVVKGIDKQQVGQIAAEIRKVRPPEPYKGKGIRYEGEYVRRKVGKRA